MNIYTTESAPCLSELKHSWPSCVFFLGAKSRLSTWPPWLLPLCPGESLGPGLLIRKFLNMAGLPVTNYLTLPMTFLNQTHSETTCLLTKKKGSHFRRTFFVVVCLKQWTLSPEFLHLTRLPSCGRSCELRLKLAPAKFSDAVNIHCRPTVCKALCHTL